ncbi:hypothetical protein Dcar01_02469 [Deinococcus carri]|uniref:Peptidase C-terminal archaeal/bacterial domain-containing protein n=1 Tax=Deinococcus carri TaxID=1211323 RepID=A0ABP9W8S8_9DEIO
MKAHRSLSLALLTGLLLSACGTGGTPSGDTGGTKDTQAPQVALTVAPTQLTAAGQATFTATATDNVGVTAVEFYDGDKLIATDKEAPFTVSQGYAAADNGTHTIKAVAVDAAGNRGTATGTLTVNIPAAPSGDTEAPKISLAATPTTVTAGGSVKLVATASDNVGVTKVTFYRGDTKLGEDTSAPYELTDTVAAGTQGSVTYRVVASDAAGNMTEASTTVAVNAAGNGPAVSLTALPSTLTLGGQVTFSAAITNGRSVSRVEFYDNGRLVGTDNEAPYMVRVIYGYADNGVHNITVRAYDDQGNVGEASTTVTVAITDANEPNDSLVMAAPLTIGVSQKGTIAGQARDFDYFKFNAASGDMLKLTVKSVSVNSASTLDPYVMILMPDGKTVLEKDDDSGAGLESEIRFNVPKDGTYYVVVTSFNIHDDEQASDDKATNTYQLDLMRR